ncbi:MAG: histidine phosphatase family protein [Arhodomonas sp.]|nr:histidine phosphatase family protein [Arhodomonas sp.]
MLQVLVLRHAIAEDRAEAARAGIPDPRRALTDKGIRRMREVAAGLATVMASPRRIRHSPLRRARETAEILAAAFPSAALEESAALTPGMDPAGLDDVLRVPDSSPVVLVGHEPDLGLWLARALQGEPARPLPLKKAGSALVTFPGAIGPGEAELEWLLPPRLARRLGGLG